MRNFFIISFILLIFSSLSFGAGFGLYEFGARASTLGGAVVAQSFDASSIFYNPAGLALQKGTQFYGGVTLINPQNRYIGPNIPVVPGSSDKIWESEDRLHTPLGIYFSHSFSEKLAAGIGLTNPFGLGLEWSENFPGRFVSKNVDLKSYYISPVVSYRITPQLSVGGGVDIVYSTVKLNQNILFAFPNDPTTEPGVEVGEIVLEGNSKIAMGFAASLLYKIEKLSLGFLYRHQVKNEFEEGDANITLFNTPYKSFLENQGLFVDQNASTEITYPSFISVGVHYLFTEKLGVEFDYMWYKWEVFDELELKFDKSELNTTVRENYSNSSQVRVGVHYSLTEALEVRGGYIYDQTPQPKASMSPLLPDNDRNDLSIGVGYQLNNMRFDVGYMRVDFGERSTLEDGKGLQYENFNGTYASLAHLFFFSYGITL